MLKRMGQSGGVVGVILLAVMSSAGCGGHSGGAAGGGAETPQTGGASNDGGNPVGQLPSEFESDIRDARVPACQKTQLFALETCWDRVLWSDHGELALEGAAGRLEIVVKGGGINPKVSALYQFAEDEGGNTRVINDRLDALRRANPMRGYWFLPSEMITIGTKAGQPSGMVLQDAKFSLGSWAFAVGTASICAHDLPMPLTQGAVETACNVQAGDAYEWILRSPEAFVHMEFYGNTWDKGPGLLQRRTVGAIRIVHRDATDGGAS